PFGKKNIEGESRFAGTTQTSDYHHLITRNLHGDVLEIMLARAVDGDGAIATVHSKGRRCFRCAWHLFTVILSGVEGFRSNTFKLLPRGSSTALRFARNDRRFRSD